MRGNVNDARALAVRTARLIRQTGRGEVFAGINTHQAAFVDRDLFVVIYDAKLHVLAHGADRSLVGSDFSMHVNDEGLPIVQLMRTAASRGINRVPLRFINPATGALEYWLSCVVLEQDLLIEVSVRGRP